MNKLARATATQMQPTKNLKTSNADPKLRIAHPPVMSVNGLYKSYRKGNIEVPVLKGVDLTIPTGDFTTIIGTSGSGKSTLLHLLGTLDAPDSGEILYNDRRIDNLPARKRAAA
ncbi:ATP-binding cassette domain-containing protein [Mariniblastus sp.]|nr:ATP-binding cassette domain-containing protein [Mariniblastus sp.]